MPPPSLSEALLTMAECATSTVAPAPSDAIPPPLAAFRLPSISELSTRSVGAWVGSVSGSQPDAGRQVATRPPARKPLTRTRRRPRPPLVTHAPDSVRPGSWVRVTSRNQTSGLPSATEIRHADEALDEA